MPIIDRLDQSKVSIFCQQFNKIIQSLQILVKIHYIKGRKLYKK